jgi:hypothetical protein
MFALLIVTPLVVFALPQSGSTPGSPTADLHTIVVRMEQAADDNREQSRAHVLTRQFRIAGRKQQPYSEVLAEVTFTPPAKKEFRILNRTGSSRGEGIVRRLLEDETKAAASEIGEVSRENYRFALLGETWLDGSA